MIGCRDDCHECICPCIGDLTGKLATLVDAVPPYENRTQLRADSESLSARAGQASWGVLEYAGTVPDSPHFAINGLLPSFDREPVDYSHRLLVLEDDLAVSAGDHLRLSASARSIECRELLPCRYCCR